MIGHSERRTAVLAVTAVVVTVVLWASAFVAIRHVGRQLSAGPLALGRLVVGSAVLGAVLLARGRGESRPAGSWRRGDVRVRLITVGVLWFGVYNVALNAAERRVDAGTAAMLVNIGPILIAILAGITLREGFPRPLVVGGLIAFGGVVVIGLSTSHVAGADGWGVVLCLVAAIVYAVAVVTQKPLLATLSALQVTWAACTIGLVVCLPFAPTLIREIGHADASTVWWVVYLGAMPTALAFTTWAYALARTSAGRLGATTYLVPPIAIALGWLFLGEHPASLAYAGGVGCLFGVYVSRRATRPTAPSGPSGLGDPVASPEPMSLGGPAPSGSATSAGPVALADIAVSHDPEGFPVPQS